VLEVWFMYCNVDVSVVNRYTIACCRLFLIAVAALNVRRSIHGTAFAIYIYIYIYIYVCIRRIFRLVQSDLIYISFTCSRKCYHVLLGIQSR